MDGNSGRGDFSRRGAPGARGQTADPVVTAGEDPSALDSPIWFVLPGSEPEGPFSTREMRRRIQFGSAERTCLVWREGMTDWAVLTKTDLSDCLPPSDPRGRGGVTEVRRPHALGPMELLRSWAGRLSLRCGASRSGRWSTLAAAQGTVLLAFTIYLLVQVIPVVQRGRRMDEAMRRAAAFGSVTSAESMRGVVAETARRLELNLHDGDIEVLQATHDILVRVRYVEEVRLFGLSLKYEMSKTARGPALYGADSLRHLNQ